MATTSADPQKIEILNAMGLLHQEYQNTLYAYALANPSGYAKLRAEVIQKVKIEGIKNLHSTFYHLLKYGAIDATSIFGTGKQELIKVGGTTLKPMYPEHELNEFCYGACEGMEKLLDKALKIILAENAEAILRSKYAQVGAMPTEPATT